MTRTRLIPILGLIIALFVVAVLPACCPDRCCNDCPQHTVGYTLLDPITIKDAYGHPVTNIRVPKNTPIEWINQSQGQVQIHFTGCTVKVDDLEVDDVVLQPGETKVTKTPGTITAGTCSITTNWERGGSGPSPGIEECPPPPAKCP